MSKLSEWKSEMTRRFGANTARWDQANVQTQECARIARGTAGGSIARMKAYFDCRTGKKLEKV